MCQSIYYLAWPRLLELRKGISLHRIRPSQRLASHPLENRLVGVVDEVEVEAGQAVETRKNQTL